MLRLLIMVSMATLLFAAGLTHTQAEDKTQFRRSGPNRLPTSERTLAETSAMLDAVIQRLDAVDSENQKLRGQLNAFLESDRQSIDVEDSPHWASASSSDPFCDTCCGAPSEGLSWCAGDWQVKLFGAATVETVYASERSTSRPFILFVGPKEQTQQKQFTVTGQSTQIGLRLDGPSYGTFQTGALILVDFHGDRPVFNESSPYFLRGFGEIFNDDWRFAFGQNGDVVAPLAPIGINWTKLSATGNFGFGQRGQVRLDRYLYPSENTQVTITAALSQQVVNDFIDIPTFSASDNGVPNFESRIALGLGPDEQGERPIEVGISGVTGRLIDIDNFGSLESDTWGYALDARVSGENIGIRGEVFHGKAIGTYNGAINQTLNFVTGLPVKTTGGWGQVWVKPCPYITIAIAYGVDDPRDADLGPVIDSGGNVTGGMRSRNQALVGTVLWNVMTNFQLGAEVGRWKTDYVAPSVDNEATVVLTRATLKF